ncbi:uncharacterized protein SCODWIG_01445 [Saccharomycodes ludwigii]|uniref:SHSP domain-containing protein n=1 Tax=Saccharomycodes ludwigii TaxID=36035 RepID=A0A376B5C6_9ASCO|nr:hypothetical protein SCDLUD_001813 [Saccharomycodes ludwigii]KAH3902024.1 hypothetical protein SCDLUD_001813 [Saccharomycodes ludwigii]SSD59684.1 uncharacterized protein SCODWIG_01445 [Saccharomycodes ludwigii]
MRKRSNNAEERNYNNNNNNRNKRIRMSFYYSDPNSISIYDLLNALQASQQQQPPKRHAVPQQQQQYASFNPYYGIYPNGLTSSYDTDPVYYTRPRARPPCPPQTKRSTLNGVTQQDYLNALLSAIAGGAVPDDVATEEEDKKKEEEEEQEGEEEEREREEQEEGEKEAEREEELEKNLLTGQDKEELAREQFAEQLGKDIAEEEQKEKFASVAAAAAKEAPSFSKRLSFSENPSSTESSVSEPIQVSKPEISLNLPFSPEVDVYDAPDLYAIVLSLPGSNSKAFQIDFHPSSYELVIKGKHDEKDVNKDLDSKYLKVSEMKTGAFERTIKFPVLPKIKDECIKASYSNGLLTVKIPKVDGSSKPIPKRRIVIEDVPDEELTFEENVPRPNTILD